MSTEKLSSVTLSLTLNSERMCAYSSDIERVATQAAPGDIDVGNVAIVAGEDELLKHVRGRVRGKHVERSAGTGAGARSRGGIGGIGGSRDERINDERVKLFADLKVADFVRESDRVRAAERGEVERLLVRQQAVRRGRDCG